MLLHTKLRQTFSRNNAHTVISPDLTARTTDVTSCRVQRGGQGGYCTGSWFAARFHTLQMRALVALSPDRATACTAPRGR